MSNGIQCCKLFDALFHKVGQLEEESSPLCPGHFKPLRSLVGFLRSLRRNVDVGFVPAGIEVITFPVAGKQASVNDQQRNGKREHGLTTLIENQRGGWMWAYSMDPPSTGSTCFPWM